MEPELDGRSAWDAAWKGLEIRTTCQISTSDRKDLQPGLAVIIPGIPRERPSEVHFMLEGHTLKLTWEHGRLAHSPE